MSVQRLTQQRVNSIKSRPRQFTIRDAQLRGFGVRVLPSGAKRYFIHSQHKGVRVWKDIGDASSLTLIEARVRAVSILASLRKGEPIVAQKETQFEVVADEVLRRYKRHWKPRTYQVSLNYFENHILPWFRGRLIGDIGRHDVQRWFASLHATPAAADRSAPVLSVIMKQAEAYGYREEGSNPCVGIKRYRRRGRERFLSADELRRLDRALRRHETGHPTETAIIRLLVLTGCRKGEVFSLRWADYRENKLFLLDSKTGPRTVWLSSAARNELDRLPRGKRWIFPSKRTRGPVSTVDPVWHSVRDEAGLNDVRLHDLRHTYASIALNEGETILTIGKLLGHRDPETTLKYTHLTDAAVQAAADSMGPLLGGGR